MEVVLFLLVLLFVAIASVFEKLIPPTTGGKKKGGWFGDE